MAVKSVRLMRSVDRLPVLIADSRRGPEVRLTAPAAEMAFRIFEITPQFENVQQA